MTGNPFLDFMDKWKDQEAFHLELYYSKTMDWCLKVYKKNCGFGGPTGVVDLVIYDGQDIDLGLLFAEAEVAVKKWAVRTNGGY